MTLEYGVLHPDLFGIDAFLDGIKTSGHFGADKGFTASIADRLHIDPESQGGKEAIFSYYYDKIIGNGVYYHGFNGAFEDAIREHGLDPQMRHWDNDEVRGIMEICAKAGSPIFLGSSGIDGEGRTHYSSTPFITYPYAAASPEWFSEFAGGAYAPGEKSSAFLRRDTQAAKDNVAALCDQMQAAKPEDVRARRSYPPITVVERDRITAFFTKYWDMFAGSQSQPTVALIPRSAVNGRTLNLPRTFATAASLYGRNPHEVPVEDAIGTVRRLFADQDSSTTESIPPEKFSIVKLPEPQRLFTKK